jgi:hypothetical protein
MAIKISNTDVINNNRKGILESVNPGAYATGAEPASPTTGDIIHNSTENEPQYWDGTSWKSLYKCDGGAGGVGFPYPPTEAGTVKFEVLQPSVLAGSGRVSVGITGVTSREDIVFTTLGAWGGFVHVEDGGAVAAIDGSHSYTIGGHGGNPGATNPFTVAVQDAELNTYTTHGYQQASGYAGWTTTTKIAPDGSKLWQNEWGVSGSWSLPLNSVVTKGGTVINMWRHGSFSGTRIVVHNASTGAYIGARQVQGTGSKSWPCQMQANDDASVVYISGVDANRPYVVKLNTTGSGMPSVAWGRRCNDSLCNNSLTGL